MPRRNSAGRLRVDAWELPIRLKRVGVRPTLEDHPPAVAHRQVRHHGRTRRRWALRPGPLHDGGLSGSPSGVADALPRDPGRSELLDGVLDCSV